MKDKTRDCEGLMPAKNHDAVSLANAVRDGGGVLFTPRMLTRRQFRIEVNTLATYAPGCGLKTFVSGTNGGQMPCGALLTRFGKTEPYFCAECSVRLNVL